MVTQKEKKVIEKKVEKNLERKIEKKVNQNVEKKIKKEVEKRVSALDKAKSKALKFKDEFKKHTLTAVSAAFGFLIALSWREPISDLVNYIIEAIGVSEKFILYKFISAVVITIVAVLALMVISKWNSKE